MTPYTHPADEQLGKLIKKHLLTDRRFSVEPTKKALSNLAFHLVETQDADLKLPDADIVGNELSRLHDFLDDLDKLLKS